MNRQQWKDIGETIGFMAIVASLVFVGIETRNSTRQSELNTQALEIMAYQSLMSNIDEINAMALTSSEAAKALATIWTDDPDDPHDFQQERLMFILFRHGDLSYFMYERGAIDEGRLKSALAIVPLHTEVARKFWEKHGDSSFTDGYRNYVNELIAEWDASNNPE